MNLLFDWAMRVPPVLIYAAMTADALRDPTGGPARFGVNMTALAAAAFALAVVAMVAPNPFKPDVFRRRHLVAFAPLAMAGFIVAWGLMNPDTIADPRDFLLLETWRNIETAWPAYGLVALAGGCILAGLAAIGANAGFRAFTATLVIIQLYAAGPCVLIAILAMTGTMPL
jgi:hypothetical protein